ncbi:AAA family ATPase [Cryobacterium sp. M23]|uniref:AAA family ATPase n=1 Tax=Cryobacterium sp. M23 TaxID=2048292 RepID=UPI00351AA13D
MGITVESQPIPRLAENSSLADWIETGMQFHAPDDVCKFCQQGTVTAESLGAYAQHFSEALDALRERLRKAVVYLTDNRADVRAWLDTLPSPHSLLVNHRDAIQIEVERLAKLGSALQTQIDTAITLIEARLADPLKPLGAEQRLTDDFHDPDASELLQLVNGNNAACSQQAERKKEAQTAVEGHFGAAYGVAYRRCEGRIRLSERAALTLDRRERSLQTRAGELEQAQEDTGRMAIAIDADLREHFGHGHLKISVSEDGKGYLVERGSKGAKRLSEGERNAIAFAYFLRSLESEGVDPAQTIVVIDDPVSSMDKESLFAGFALAEERTKLFAQVIVLTHDYEYFRLQLGQRANARKSSEKKIRENDSNERAFPAVSILEIRASVNPTSDSRVSSMRKLPPSLLQHPSEYHYLFLKVAEAVRDGDHETLPLLGNAARRLLEGFISFRAPSGGNFQQKVDLITKAASIDGVLARRVVKFMHGQSHREEPRPTSALDFPSVEAELRAALDFMRRADGPHFEEMCKAVDVDHTTIIAALGTNTVTRPAAA